MSFSQICLINNLFLCVVLFIFVRFIYYFCVWCSDSFSDFCPLVFVTIPSKISGTESTYNPSPRNLSEKNQISIFCGFTDEGKTVTPNTTVQHEEEPSYLMECVDPNINPNKNVLTLLESQDNEESNSIFKKFFRHILRNVSTIKVDPLVKNTKNRFFAPGLVNYVK